MNAFDYSYLVRIHFGAGCLDGALAGELAGINALEAFIEEMGLPTRFSQMGITDAVDIFQKVADTCILTGGCARTLPRQEIFDLLHEVA